MWPSELCGLQPVDAQNSAHSRSRAPHNPLLTDAKCLGVAGTRVSGVDEDAVIDRLGPSAAPELVVTMLAEAKARDVVPSLVAEGFTDAVVIGCDSMLLIDGELQGKPHTVDVARRVQR